MRRFEYVEGTSAKFWMAVLTEVSRLKVVLVVVAFPSPVIEFACRFMFELLFFFRRSGVEK